MDRFARLSTPAVALFLLGVMVSFWYFAVVEPADSNNVTLASVDLYMEHYPVVKYAGEQLAQGRLPLWNPYQMNGLPFLAIPHTGIFYLPNLIYLWSNTGVAIELALVFHLLFAGIGLWLLIRVWGMSHLAGFAAATSFMLSRWLIDANFWPVVVQSVAWLPWTLLSIEMIFRRKRWAPIVLALVLASQLFNGATEFVIYNGYASTLFVALRAIRVLHAKEAHQLARHGALLLCGVIGGVGLSAIQLLPTLELVSESSRLADGISLGDALVGAPMGHLPAHMFLPAMWSGKGWAALGVLPLLGMFFPPRDHDARLLWFFALVLGVCAMFLIFGGAVFELYFNTPLGQLFRRPVKFFYWYNFAQGILAACAVTRLLDWRNQGALPFSRRSLQKAWLAAGVTCLGWTIWLVWTGDPKPWILTSVALFMVSAFVNNRSMRVLVCVALCATQVGNLFSVPRNTSMRPFKQENRYDGHGELLDRLRDEAGHQRIHIGPKFLFEPAVMHKQGQLRRAYFATDYEPLVTARQARYFLRASGAPVRTKRTKPFNGGYSVSKRTRWALLDHASVRFYLVSRNDGNLAGLRAMAKSPKNTGVRVHPESLWLEVIERARSLPRAYFVPNARAVENPDDILDLLGKPRFRARRQVLLETSQGAVTRRGGKSTPKKATVNIRTPDPETVILEVFTGQPGFVVLTDSWYPGWRVTVDGREAKLYRANYLFRAVEVDAGHSTVAFRYEPESFYKGAQISGAFLLAILLSGAWLVFRRQREFQVGIDP